MSRNQLYADMIFTGLVPVEPVRRIPPDPPIPAKYEVRVTKTVRAYKKGDLIEEPARYLVEKAGFRGFHQMVRTPWDLDERFEKAEKERG